jgi:hypothetical protein
MISGRLLTQTSSVLPEQPGILPLEFNTGNLGSWNCSRDCLEQTQTLHSGQVFHGFSQANTAHGFRDESGYPAEVVPVPRTEIRFRMEEPPPTV